MLMNMQLFNGFGGKIILIEEHLLYFCLREKTNHIINDFLA